MRDIEASTFTLVCNGASDAPPAAAVREFLVSRPARRVTAVYHPLGPEDEPRHSITVYEPDREPRRRVFRLPSRTPYTYGLDPFIPLWPERVDCWVGFNNLAAGRGLLQRRLGRAGKVVYWAIDFVPNRFGRGLLTRSYDALDAFCCRHVDRRFEVSQSALEARSARHGLAPAEAAPADVAPMGAWLARVPVAPEDAWRKLGEFVASGSVAVAPYDTAEDSFTRFADPSKVRAYMAGGLPVVMTDVPPNADELAAEGGAELVPYTAEGLADGIERALSSVEDWQRRREAALSYSSGFDWEVIVGRAPESVGFGA